MRRGFLLGDFELIWLNGGRFELDGGAMFGVVPKALWQKKYPATDENTISMCAWPILIKTPNALVLIETGLGNKLTDKQKKIFRVKEEWSVIQELGQLGIARQDVDFVILTHYDFDHAGGVIMQDETGRLGLTFPMARHILQKKEWEDVLSPNVRSMNTYWPINIELMKGNDNLELVDGETLVVPGISVLHTGGHNSGHQIVQMKSKTETALHLGDLFPTHAHANPLWVMAYDNYPMDSIAMKEKWFKIGTENGAWFTFYHDPYQLACKLDEKGNVVQSWGNDYA